MDFINLLRVILSHSATNVHEVSPKTTKHKLLVKNVLQVIVNTVWDMVLSTKSVNAVQLDNIPTKQQYVPNVHEDLKGATKGEISKYKLQATVPIYVSVVE